jgi:rod shape-determining protein MreD
MIIAAGLAQASSFDYIIFSGAKPDILLILIIFASLLLEGRDVIKCAVIAGIFKDMSSSLIAGSHVAAFILLALVLNTQKKKFYSQKPLVQIGLSFVSYIFMDTCVFILNAIAYRRSGVLCFPVMPILKAAAYTCIVSPVVFVVASKVLRIDLSRAY